MLTRIYGTAFYSQTDLDDHLGAARAGARARPPPPRPRARPVPASATRRRGCRSGCRTGPCSCALIEARGPRAARASAATREIKTPRGARRGALAPLGPLGQLPREHVLRRARRARARGRRAPLRAQADELPRRLPRLRLRAATPTASCRCGSPSSATSRATSARASCTACCGCARSPRTTPTSTARSSRSPTRSTRSARRSTSSTRASASTRSGSSSRPGPRSRSAPTSSGSGDRGGLREALERQGRDYEVSPGEGDLLRAEDRLPRHRRARALLAVRHLPARLPDAGALRAHLPGRGQRRAPPGDDPPRPARLDGALRRDPDRAPRRPLPALARARCRRSCCRSPTATSTTRGERRAPSSHDAGVRVRVDERSESVGRKIRDAELAKVPFMLVVGEREAGAAGRVSVRSHERGDLGAMALAEVVERLARRSPRPGRGYRLSGALPILARGNERAPTIPRRAA